MTTVTYRALSIQQPIYLVILLHFSDIAISSGSKQLFVPKTKLNIGERAFCVAAPTIWNKLPITIKSSETIDTFRKKLKTNLFEIAFPPYMFGGFMLQAGESQPEVALSRRGVHQPITVRESQPDVDINQSATGKLNRVGRHQVS